MAKQIKSKREKQRERHERRFEPQATVGARVAYTLGGIGSLLMGAGGWEQFGSLLRDDGPPPLAAAPFVLVVGALLLGLAIWLGTSAEAALRVGDGGVATEKGGIRRIPWFSVERVEWRGEAVRVVGQDDSGAALTLVAPVAKQPQAAAWIVKEARDRVPNKVDVPADATLPEALPGAGQALKLDPPQIVGKRCEACASVIAFEPEAYACMRCERVYHKTHLPEACACGGSLAA